MNCFAARFLCCLAIALIATVAGTKAFGCSCMGPLPPCQQFGQSTAVFIGTPISVSVKERPATRDANDEDLWTPVTFKFTVDQSFLGAPAKEIEVSTGRGGGDCGYQFKLGTPYVVYAYGSAKNRLTTSICTRTSELDRAKADIEFLRTLETRNPGVSISGQVAKRLKNIAKGDSSAAGPLAGIGLSIEGPDVHKELVTDDDGKFNLAGLPPGKFKVMLSLPDELWTYKKEQELTIANRGCASVYYEVVDNGRLSGTVLDPVGQPAAKILLTLIETDHADVMKSWFTMERTDENGHYSFSSLPPGKYFLVVNDNRYPEPNDPTGAFPKTYYPGVADIAKAEAITLGTGENLTDRNFQLPTRRTAAVIRGKVVWNDGTPVLKPNVSFREVTDHDSGMNNGMQADEQGYFTINGYVGQTFIIDARSNRPYDGDPRRFEPMERVDPVRVVIRHPTETLTIVITKLR